MGNGKGLKTALTIAGSDSSGGAGIQADIKAFQANGVFGMSALTAVTVQNTQGVTGVQDMMPEIISGQINSVFEDIEINAIKIGMLSSVETIKIVSETLKDKDLPQVVLDPVMISKSGFLLIADDAIDSMKELLFPLASIVTPNTHEASRLTGIEINTIDDMKKACEEIIKTGCKSVLVKGGHLEGEECVDVLFDGKEFRYFTEKRINTKNTHGTGCTLSSAIAANLAKGHDLFKSVENSKEYITGAIENSLEIGHGCGPTHHFYKYY